MRPIEETSEEGIAGVSMGSTTERRSVSSTPSTNQIVNQFWQKQMEIANKQSTVQQKLLENAEIANEEAKERLKLVKAQREKAEIELQIKERELNSFNLIETKFNKQN